MACSIRRSWASTVLSSRLIFNSTYYLGSERLLGTASIYNVLREERRALFSQDKNTVSLDLNR